MIYAIQAGEGGPIKFGVARNPSWRIRELQTGNHERLILLVAVNIEDGCERQIHQWLSADRLHGEWFRCSDAAKSVIRDLQIRSGLGDGDQTHPEPKAYEAEYRRLFPEEFETDA